MIKETIIALALASNVGIFPVVINTGTPVVQEQTIAASHDLNLTDRLPNSYGSQIFADNILLSLHFLKGDVDSLQLTSASTITGPDSLDWDKARKPFEVSFMLKPGESFAFHKEFLPEFTDSIKYSMNSRFYIEEGYKSLAGLGGNGVCHLASLIDWVASNSGLEVVAKVNHDFYPVPDVPRQYGVAIFYPNKDQNLYIKNNFDYPVTFVFNADNKNVKLTIKK